MAIETWSGSLNCDSHASLYSRAQLRQSCRQTQWAIVNVACCPLECRWSRRRKALLPCSWWSCMPTKLCHRCWYAFNALGACMHSGPGHVWAHCQCLLHVPVLMPIAAGTAMPVMPGAHTNHVVQGTEHINAPLVTGSRSTRATPMYYTSAFALSDE
jgi:hypothetical protein